MSELIERIKERIRREFTLNEDFCDYISVARANRIIDEESAKEPQEEPNIPIQCVDGSCPIALSEEYEECCMDVVHSCAECQYQPQVQQIVRTPEEITYYKCCKACGLNARCERENQRDCDEFLEMIDWLTGKQV